MENIYKPHLVRIEEKREETYDTNASGHDTDDALKDPPPLDSHLSGLAAWCEGWLRRRQASERPPLTWRL